MCFSFSFQENSFLQPLGYVELDLPKVPEKATRPPPQAVDPYLRYGPKAEIAHIFRVPEKRPPQEVSFAFLGLVFVPFLTFLVGVSLLSVHLLIFDYKSGPLDYLVTQIISDPVFYISNQRIQSDSCCLFIYVVKMIRVKCPIVLFNF